MARGPGKGNTNNPNGRPKGVPNKTTAEIRDRLNVIIEAESEHISVELAKLREEDPQKYLNVLEKFISYVVPKKRDITSDDKSIQPTINISENRSESEAD
jgi:hypothetical protein